MPGGHDTMKKMTNPHISVFSLLSLPVELWMWVSTGTNYSGSANPYAGCREKKTQRIMTITTNAMSNLNKLVSCNNRMVSVEWCQHSTLTKKPLSNMVAKSLSILNWIPLRLRAVLFIKAILPFAIMLDALKWEKYSGDIVKLQTD